MNNAILIFTFPSFEQSLSLDVIPVPQSNSIFYVGALGRLYQ